MPPYRFSTPVHGERIYSFDYVRYVDAAGTLFSLTPAEVKNKIRYYDWVKRGAAYGKEAGTYVVRGDVWKKQ